MNSIHTDTVVKVSLAQILDARELRAFHQKKLLDRFQKPLLCFTMNIAGPVKNNALIKEGFQIGLYELKMAFRRNKIHILYEELQTKNTGNTAYFVVDYPEKKLKQLTCEIEDFDKIGRLFDMDVLSATGYQLSRSDIGLPKRCCLLCERNAKECSSRRIHTVEELWNKTQQILQDEYRKRTSHTIARMAQKALLYEVSITPKPGLVDRANNGSHKDMDFYTFLNSSVSLYSYFQDAALLGLSFTSYTDTFSKLRSLGKRAENEMFAATSGINTHKGAIFTLGILSCAIAIMGLSAEYNDVFECCKQLCVDLCKDDFHELNSDNATSVGQQLYLKFKIRGIRGELEDGLPTIKQVGLPILKQSLSSGKTLEEASIMTLLAIMLHIDDTNLISRSDLESQKTLIARLRQQFQDLSSIPDFLSEMEKLDREFIANNLSPGGSADLLAACLMLYFWKTSFH